MNSTDIIKKARKRKNINNIIREQLKESKKYIELEENYKKYVIHLANFFKKIGITNGVEVAVFYNRLLKSGILSYNKITNYEELQKLNKPKYRLYDKYEILDTLGSRVATGKSLYRHNTALLTDLQNELGNPSINMPVQIKNKYSKNKKLNHIITTTKDKETSTIFSSCPSFGIISELKYNIDSFIHIPKYNINRKRNQVFVSPIIYPTIPNCSHNIDLQKELDIAISSYSKNNIVDPEIFYLSAIKVKNEVLKSFDISENEIEYFYNNSKDELTNIFTLVNKCYSKEITKSGKILNYRIW